MAKRWDNRVSELERLAHTPGFLSLREDIIALAQLNAEDHVRGEHPASITWWQEALKDAGFAEVAVRPLPHEGGIATAQQTS